MRRLLSNAFFYFFLSGLAFSVSAYFAVGLWLSFSVLGLFLTVISFRFEAVWAAQAAAQSKDNK